MALILMAESDSFLVTLYTKAFISFGYEVCSASSGTSCLQMVERVHPAAVILSLVIPDIDGYQVLKRLRASESTKSLPVLILTKLAEREDIRKCEDLGCNGYFIQPHVQPVTVVSAVRSLVPA